MIYQDVRRYLKNLYEKPTLEISWSHLDNLKFFNYIEDRYSLERFEKDISEVKEAFRDYFEPVGTVVFRYKQESGVRFKVFPYRVQPKDSKHLKNIVKIINSNRKAIKYPYKGQNDQIAITGKIRRAINVEIYHTDESVNKKELIKYAIRKALELSDRDVIIQLKRLYLIKIFEENKLTKDTDTKVTQREGVQNRYNGYTQEEFEESYNNMFSNLTLDEFLEPIMKTLFATKLNFAEISNKYYEENALKIIHKQIAKELINYLSYENDYLIGLAGYIFRKHFYKIHELIAIELLEEVYNKVANAEKFLMYYNGMVIVEDSKKYKIPALETKDGKLLSNSSILGLSALWINTKKKKEIRKEKLKEANRKILETEESLISVKLKIKELKSKIESATKEIDKTKSSLNEQVKLFEDFEKQGLTYSAKENEVKDAIARDEEKLIRLKSSVIEYQKEIQNYEKSNQELNQYQKYKRELQKDIEEFDKNIQFNLERVKVILEALVDALISRKKLVKE